MVRLLLARLVGCLVAVFGDATKLGSKGRMTFFSSQIL
jgi:hypothetical protein